MANILIVDDSAAMGGTDALREELQKMGHLVWEAIKDKDAFQKCTERDFDLIIMDMSLTYDSLDGVALTKELKKRGVRAKCILHCGWPGASVDKEAVKLFDHVIGKGHERELSAMVESLFGKRNPERR